MKDVSAFLFEMLMGFISLVAIPGIPWIFKKLVEFVQSKTSSEWLKAFEARLGNAVRDAVLSASQVLVDDFKAAKDPDSDGGVELTEEERKRAFMHAFQAAMQALGTGFIAKIDSIAGKGTVASAVTSAIEATVKQLKLDKDAMMLSTIGKDLLKVPGTVEHTDAAPSTTIPLGG